MLTSTPQSNEISAYPGEYTPIRYKYEKLAAELSKTHKITKNPSCNISETSEYYKIELAAPGLEREDLFVSITDEGHLAIKALHKAKRIQNEKYSKHALNYEYFNCELVLPANVDTDFLKTEYLNGILSFWFLKTEKKYQKTPSTIIVY